MISPATPAASPPAPVPPRSPEAFNRVVLLPAPRAKTDAQVRRYRLARVRLEGRDALSTERHPHLRRLHD